MSLPQFSFWASSNHCASHPASRPPPAGATFSVAAGQKPRRFNRCSRPASSCRLENLSPYVSRLSPRNPWPRVPYLCTIKISWPDLHKWSISEVDQFWRTVSDFCGIKWLERGAGNAYTPPPPPFPTSRGVPPASAAGEGRNGGQGRGGVMTDARWFEGAKLNFAHNLIPPPTDKEV